MTEHLDLDFFSGLPDFSNFEGVADPGNFRPLPEGWVLAIADVVDSTSAIAAGRYRDANIAGASVISAVLNAVGRSDLPFAFGGDGALVALPGIFEAAARIALAAVQTWAAEELDLSLRVAVVPLAEVRSRGFDVAVARYSPSPFVSYAMFSGGGTSWAERQMKAGLYGVVAAQPRTRPNLDGLSCRWEPLEAKNGEIVSIIALPGRNGAGEGFQRLVADVVAISAEQDRAGHPVPVGGPALAVSASGIDREARAGSVRKLRFARRMWILLQIAWTVFLHRTGLRFGERNVREYASDVAGNSDFRKFDDGLKMTVDIDGAHLDRIRRRLEEAVHEGVAEYGLHRQASALVTCFVPTPNARDHVHFIDGAGGGYAVAAGQIKSSGQAWAAS